MDIEFEGYATGDEDIDVLETADLDNPRLLNIKNATGPSCRRPYGLDKDDELRSALAILSSGHDNTNPDCQYSEVSSACQTIFMYMNEGTDENLKFNAADCFFRARHEHMFSCVCKFLRLEASRSDVRFDSLFPIPSSRTPDYIWVSGKAVLLIELAATSGVDRAYASKGTIVEGYQSKYQPEINMLNELGYAVQYETLIFDMHDAGNTDYRDSLRRCVQYMDCIPCVNYRRIIELTRKVWLDVTVALKSTLNQYASSLLAGHFVPTHYPRSVDVYTRQANIADKTTRFRKCSVSNNTYMKILNSWPRFHSLLAQHSMDDDHERYKLSYDISRGRFQFESTPSGINYMLWSVVLNNRDRPTLLKNFILLYSGMPFTEERSDIEYYVEVTSETCPPSGGDWPIEVHAHATPYSDTYAVKDLCHLSQADILTGRVHKFYQHDYGDKLVDRLQDFYQSIQTTDEFDRFSSSLTNKAPFANNTMSVERLGRALSAYSREYDNKNDFSDTSTSRVRHQKPAFIYPLACPDGFSYTTYNSKNTKMLCWLATQDIGQFTRTLLLNASSNSYQMGTTVSELSYKYQEMMEERRQIQSEMNRRMTTLRRDADERGSRPDFSTDQELKAFKERIKEINKQLPPGKKDIHLIRMNTKGKNSVNKSLFAAEMTHYKSKTDRASTKGVGRFDHGVLQNEFNNIVSALLRPSETECPDDLMDTHIANDVEFLKGLKRATVSRAEPALNRLKNTNLYHTCAIVSRLCYTLAYLSQHNFKGSEFMLDNLGTDNCLLICKGGKKIFSTKKSKMYRFIYPIYEEAANWYSRPGYKSSYTVSYWEGTPYIITPWTQMDETVLNDGLTFLHRCMGYVLLQGSLDIDRELERTIFNILLAFNNRRKLETLMHNMRYITVNCMSTLSSIEKMLPEMASFNYDFFDCFIKESILCNFLRTSSKLLSYHDDPTSGLQAEHMINSSFIMRDESDLTMSIYSTFLMSKAPVTQSLEQSNNLKSILDTHKKHGELNRSDIIGQYTSDAMVTLQDDLSDYWGRLFGNDFAYDPSYVSTVGTFAADYISSKTTAGELEVVWQNILRKPWDEFANTRGLRGDKGKDFFNKKGYYVVYKKVLENQAAFNEFTSILQSADPDQKLRQRLNKLNTFYADAINSLELDYFIFHVVDKKQRGGSREIYVMDYKTKICQQPIEKFSKHLCKLFPNEVISVPSNRRVFQIHSAVFEKRHINEGTVYNAVLDCRRWAPHSAINKFIDFIVSMHSILPKTFIVHSLWFFELMFDKRVYTKSYVVEILRKNKSVQPELIEMLKEDSEQKAFYLEMPYSWMMGIFNYLSSLLHVANQMHASHIITRVTQACLPDAVTYTMYAHSDDSAGKIVAPTRLDMCKTFFIYELLLKSCNHMLSEKKCCVGLLVFEFVSVLYLDNTLMNLLTKYVGSFSFHPSDKGYAVDITDAYSKCTELCMNGATFEVAYLAFKITVKMVHRFYFGQKIPEQYYRLPTQLLGVPDAHPVMVLLAGSDADLIRLHLTEPQEQVNKMYHVSSKLYNEYDKEGGFLKPCLATPKIIQSKPLQELAEQLDHPCMNEDLRWILKNTNPRNTVLNAYKLGEMLKTATFQSSLQDETLTRRISRAFYFRNSHCIKTYHGMVSYEVLRELNMIVFFPEYAPVPPVWQLVSELDLEVKREGEGTVQHYKQAFEFLHSELIMLCQRLDKVTFQTQHLYTKKKSNKPVHINIMKHATPLVTDYNASELAAWMAFPQYRWLLESKGYSSKMNNFEDFLAANLPSLRVYDVDLTSRILEKLKTKFIKEMYIYSNMPANSRDISTYKDVLVFLSENSFPDMAINKLVTPYDRTIMERIPGSVGSLVARVSADIIPKFYFYNCCRISSTWDNYPGLVVEGTEMLGEDGLKELLSRDCAMLESEPEIYAAVAPHVKAFMNSTDGRVTDAGLKDSYYHCFVKRQHFVSNVWLGKGEIFFNLRGIQISLQLSNGAVVGCSANTSRLDFNSFASVYMDTVLQNAQLGPLRSHMRATQGSWDDVALGVDDSGIYCINQKRAVDACLPSFRLTTFGNKPYAELDESWVVLSTGSSYSAKLSQFDSKAYHIKTFDVDAADVVRVSGKLLGSETNVRLLEARATTRDELLEIVVSQGVGLELHCDVKQLFENFNSTKLYKIFKKLREEDIVDVHRVRPRHPKHPGQHGGLLSTLIDYKNVEPDFRFDYRNIMTPELMLIKSSQPEAFMSELKDKISEKFNSLYTKSDKAAIIKELKFISTMGDSQQTLSKLVQLMATWGYAGVVGALEGFEDKIDMTAVNFYRLNIGNAVYCRHANETLRALLSAIVTCAGMIGSYPDCESDIFSMPRDHEELKCQVIAYVHMYTLSSYCSVFANIGMQLNICDVNFNLMVNALLSNKVFNENFHAQINDYPILSKMYFTQDDSKTLCQIIKHCLINVMFQNRSDHKLDLTRIVNRMPDGVEDPYVKTKRVLSDIVGFNVASIKSYGMIPPKLHNWFKTPKNVTYKGRLYRLEFKLTGLSRTRVDFNPGLIFSRPLEEDYLDEDWLELQPELMEYPLGDYALSLPIVYDEPEDRRLFINNKTRANSATLLKPRVVSLIGYAGSYRPWFYLRQLGETLVIITDKIERTHMGELGPNLKPFKFVDKSWSGACLLSPQDLLVYVWDSAPINVGFWCYALGLEPLKKESLMTMGLKYEVTQIREKWGTVIEEFYTDDDVQEVVEDIQRALDNYLESKKVKAPEEPQPDAVPVEEVIEDDREAALRKLMELNPNSDFITKYKDMLSEFTRSSGSVPKFDLMNMIENLLSSESAKQELLKGVDAAVPSIMEKDTIKQVWQTPGIFCLNKPTNSDVKNKALKDNMLRAEIDAFSVGLCNKILSGNLFVSVKKRTELIASLQVAKGYIRGCGFDKQNKQFVADFCTLVMNDAQVVTRGGDDEMLQNMINFLNLLIVVNEEGSEDYDNPYTKDAEGASIRYRMFGTN